MIEAEFRRKGRRITGFSVSGHAGYADNGKDIVCAAVSSAVQMAANGVTEILHFPAEVSAKGDTVSLFLEGEGSESVLAILDAFRLQMEILEEQYPKFIRIRYLEV